MFDLPKGQLTAMQWFGLPPFWWGWILAGVAIALAVAAFTAPRPRLLAERSDTHTHPRVAHTWLIVVILGAMALHSYGFLGNFNLYDDFRQIHVNKEVNTLTWDSFWNLLWNNHKGSNQELMYLSFMFNWALAKKAYWVWYLFNWILIPPILLCVAWIARHLTGDRIAAVLACAFVATSPIMSELLCWMSARSHLYGLVFALLSCGAYLEYMGKERKKWWLLLVSVGAFYLSQMGKPIFIFVPVWLILFDVYKARRTWAIGLADKLPYFAIAVWSYYRLVIAKNGVGHGLIKKEPLGGSLLNTILQDFNLLVEYGRSTFVPSALGMAPPFNVADGPFFVDGVPMILVNGFAPLASLIILLSVLAIAIAARVRNNDALPLLWLLAAGVSLATVMNIPARGHAATFEYRYTLSANVMTAILLGDLAVRYLRGRTARRGRGRLVAAGVLGAYLCWSTLMTAANTHAWQVSHHLWVRNAEMYPQWYSARYYAGKARQWNKQPYMAVQHLLAAEKVNVRKDYALHKRLGDNAYNIERYDLAREHWQKYFTRYRTKVNEGYLKKFEKVGLVVSKNGRIHDISEFAKPKPPAEPKPPANPEKDTAADSSTQPAAPLKLPPALLRRLKRMESQGRFPKGALDGVEADTASSGEAPPPAGSGG